jgi:hypothetical protein
MDADDAMARERCLANPVAASILAAVVDEDDLVGMPGGSEHSLELGDDVGKALALLENGKDSGEDGSILRGGREA